MSTLRPDAESMWTVYRVAFGYGLALAVVVPLLIAAIYALAALFGGYPAISANLGAVSRPTFFALWYTTPFFLLMMPLLIAIGDRAFQSGGHMVRMIMPALFAPMFVAVPMGIAEMRILQGLPISDWSRFLITMDAATIMIVFAGALKHSALTQMQLRDRSLIAPASPVEGL